MAPSSLSLDEYFDLYSTAIKKSKTQRALVDFLREHNFMVVSPQTLIDLDIPIRVKPAHKGYSMMLRRIKDLEFDSRLAFAVKLLGQKRNKVHLYLNYDYMETVQLPSFNSNMNFTKVTQVWKFPNDTMPDYEERKVWRSENLKVMRDENYKPSAFYLKHAKSIFNLSSLEIPNHLIPYL
jgi:hypothetical protein